jgi:hypothetical protein
MSEFTRRELVRVDLKQLLESEELLREICSLYQHSCLELARHQLVQLFVGPKICVLWLAN